MRVRFETWVSSNNLSEVHVFLGEGDNTYLCGFNPSKIKNIHAASLLDAALPGGATKEELASFVSTLAKARREQ